MYAHQRCRSERRIVLVHRVRLVGSVRGARCLRGRVPSLRYMRRDSEPPSRYSSSILYVVRVCSDIRLRQNQRSVLVGNWIKHLAAFRYRGKERQLVPNTQRSPYISKREAIIFQRCCQPTPSHRKASFFEAYHWHVQRSLLSRRPPWTQRCLNLPSRSKPSMQAMRRRDHRAPVYPKPQRWCSR